MHDEIIKIALSRLDKEVRAGRISYSDIDPKIPKGKLPKILEPAAKQRVRRKLRASAEVAPDVLKRRRQLADKTYKAQMRAGGEAIGMKGVNLKATHLPGMGPATMGTAGGSNVHAPASAGRFARQATKGTVGRLRAVGGTFPKAEALLGKAKKVDPTLTKAIMRHEVGEAHEIKKMQKGKKITPHASHLGMRPHSEEKMVTRGDPSAQREMAKMRKIHPDDARVQKAYRQVGAIPSRPIPIGGKKERAVERIMARQGKKLHPSSRQMAWKVMLGGGKVTYAPKGVRKSGRKMMERAAETGAALKEKKWRKALKKGRKGLKHFARSMRFIKKGI